MKDSEPIIGRRDCLRISAHAAAAMSLLSLGKASAQAPSSQGVPWWAARPGKEGPGKPAAIDMHAHWSPEPYNNALVELGQRIANPYPLDHDLDKRRQWMDDHGELMHCLALFRRYAVAKNFGSGGRAPRASHQRRRHSSTSEIPRSICHQHRTRFATPSSP